MIIGPVRRRVARVTVKNGKIFWGTTMAGGGTGRETAKDPVNAIRLSERDGQGTRVRDDVTSQTISYRRFKVVDGEDRVIRPVDENPTCHRHQENQARRR